MASSALIHAQTEQQEALDVIDRKADTLADEIRRSKRFIVFTGAGVSTSAGIPDFRGPEGVWTLRAQGRLRDLKAVNTLQAIPTVTHMALAELSNRGILTYLISQNCDGLHRKSGVLPENISELHGNSNREYCGDCGKEYLRDFRAVATYEKSVHDHRTGRKCVLCGGALLDSIINFGEDLWEEPLQRARGYAATADLCLVLGSSLTVSPANEIPEIVGKRKGAQFAICNLQSTPIDDLADLRVYSKTDDLMVRVMEKLEIPIPGFVLERRLVVEGEINDNDRRQLTVSGIDVDGTPITFLRSVKLDYNRRVARSEPFIINFRDSPDPATPMKLELEFMGHYGEPNLEVCFDYSGESHSKTTYLLKYSPQTGEWQTCTLDNLDSGAEKGETAGKRERM